MNRLMVFVVRRRNNKKRQDHRPTEANTDPATAEKAVAGDLRRMSSEVRAQVRGWGVWVGGRPFP